MQNDGSGNVTIARPANREVTTHNGLQDSRTCKNLQAVKNNSTKNKYTTADRRFLKYKKIVGKRLKGLK